MDTQHKHLAKAVIASFAVFASTSAFAMNNSNLGIDAGDSASVSSAFSSGDAGISFRARVEHVKDDSAGVSRGEANTLRTKVHYNTAYWNDMALSGNFINVRSFGSGKHNQDNVLTPDKSGRALIADPQGDSVNSAYLLYRGLPDTTVTLGRQAPKFDNGRLVGSEDFRQTPKSYDALLIDNASYADLHLAYAWVNQFNGYYKGAHGETLARQSWDHETHLFNATWDGMSDMATLTGFLYIVDDKSTDTNSGTTYGVIASGSQDMSDGMMFHYAGAWARFEADRATAGASDSYDSDFNWLNLAVSTDALGPLEMVKIGLDYQLLEGNSATGAFKAPFSDSHKFQGAAGVVGAGTRGVADWSVRMDATWTDYDFFVDYHKFEVDDSSAVQKKLGTEFDLGVSTLVRDRYKVSLEYADFEAKGGNANGYSDTNKVWFTVAADFM